jgi:hypothetical protein
MAKFCARKISLCFELIEKPNRNEGDGFGYIIPVDVDSGHLNCMTTNLCHSSSSSTWMAMP